MVLTVLGKYGPFPAVGGGTSAYLLQSAKTTLALDFGSGAAGRLQRFSALKDLDAIVLSHLHSDHISDLLPLSYYLSMQGRILDVYMPLTDCPQYDVISSMKCYNIMPLFDGRNLRVNDLTLSFTKLTHPMENYGVRICDGNTSFFYSGDTVFDKNITAAANGCENVLLDASLPSDQAKDAPHMSVAEGKFISDCTGARVLLTHVNPLASPYAEAKALGVEVVEELSQYNV